MTGISVFDHRLLADSWSTQEMRAIFCEQNRIQKWLDVEAALAKAQAKLKIIPKKAADEIAKKAHYKFMDMDFIFAEFKKTKHPLVPTVRGLKAIAKALAKLAKTHKNTAMMGRTLALQALPITFGHKVAIWLSELEHHFERILELEKKLYVGSIVGAVGTKANLSDECNEVEKLTLENLGLDVPNISWQSARDRFIELGFVLGNINATFNKIAHQLLILSHNEIDEVAEPFGKGQVGSSTMPHKRNPAVSENVVTVSNAFKANLAILSDIERHEHERDGQVWKMEWKLSPEMFLMLSVVLAERVMFALSDHYGKQHAHEIVYENIPNTVIQRAKELMLDSLGTAITASKKECVLNAFKAFENLSTEKNTPIWVNDQKLDPIYAAMLDSIASHALDFDDTYKSDFACKCNFNSTLFKLWFSC